MSYLKIVATEPPSGTRLCTERVSTGPGCMSDLAAKDIHFPTQFVGSTNTGSPALNRGSPSAKSASCLRVTILNSSGPSCTLSTSCARILRLFH